MKNIIYDPGPKATATPAASMAEVRAYPLAWELQTWERVYRDIDVNEQLVFSTTRLHHGADVYLTSPETFSAAQAITLRAYARVGATRSLLQSFTMSRNTRPGQAMLALSVRQTTELLDVTLQTFDLPPVSDQKMQLAMFAGPLDSYVGQDPTAHRATGTAAGVASPEVSVRDLAGFVPYVGNTTEIDFLGFDAFNYAPSAQYLSIYDQATGPAVDARLRYVYQFAASESKSIRIPHSKHLDSRFGAIYCTVTNAPPPPFGPGGVSVGSIFGTLYVQ